MEMFTQKDHWVLSLRGHQVHSSPHGYSCMGDRRWKYSPLPRKSMAKDTSKRGFRVLSLLLGRKTNPGVGGR